MSAAHMSALRSLEDIVDDLHAFEWPSKPTANGLAEVHMNGETDLLRELQAAQAEARAAFAAAEEARSAQAAAVEDAVAVFRRQTVNAAEALAAQQVAACKAKMAAGA